MVRIAVCLLLTTAALDGHRDPQAVRSELSSRVVADEVPFHRHPVFIASVFAWTVLALWVGASAWRRRRRDRSRIKASEDRHLKLVRDIPICVHEIDPTGRLRSMNRAGLGMIGAASEKEIRGCPYLDIVCEEDRPRIADLLDRALQGHAAHFEFVALEGDGRQKTFASSFLPVRGEAGSVDRVMGYTQDITDKSDLERQLRQAQKMEAIGFLAAGVAHDFNNLLTVIGGNASLIEARVEDGESVRQSAVAIQEASDRAAAFTRQLLALGSPQMVSTRPFDLNRLIAQMKNMLGRLIGAQIELITDLCETPAVVRADPGQMEQIVLNLVVNGRDAMRAGGYLSIETSVVESGRLVQLDVRDDGAGMDAETKSRIFDPFFTTKPRESGTGLGLSTAYGIVKQLGGRISVDSEVSRGTCFTILLPQVDDAPEPVPVRGPVVTFEPGTETVLVAEDDLAVLRLVGRMLRDLGYTDLRADDPEEALRIAETHDGPIHLLLTDLIMPGMNGCQLARQFKQRRPEAVVVFMSGYADEGLITETEQISLTPFLNKPFEREALADLLDTVLTPTRT